MSAPQVSAEDVVRILVDQQSSEHSALLIKFAQCEARRLYLEDRVSNLEKIISDQQSGT